MTWIDATAQALLSAQTLIKIASVIGSRDGVSELKAEVRQLARLINETMWSEKIGFYVDRLPNGKLSNVKTIGAYWMLLTGAVPDERLNRFIRHLENPREFNRPHRVPSLSADHPDYSRPYGQYWKGGVWPSTNYMLLRGLTALGRDDLASAIGTNHHQAVVGVFETTGTVWENYAPEMIAPGQPAKGDFVGWGGVCPIAVLFEYVFGLRPRASQRRLVWDIRLLDEFGVRNYPFGPDGRIDIHCAPRQTADEPPVVRIETNRPVDIELRWQGGRKRIRRS